MVLEYLMHTTPSSMMVVVVAVLVSGMTVVLMIQVAGFNISIEENRPLNSERTVVKGIWRI